MFRDRQLSIQIRELMLTINTLLNRSKLIVQDSECSDEERRAYLQLVGKIMGITTMQIFQDICVAHPDLIPPEFSKEDIQAFQSARKKHGLP